MVNRILQNELMPSHMPRSIKDNWLKPKKSVTFDLQNNDYKPKLNAENIIRKSIKQTLIEYLSNCSLGGFKYLVDDTKTVVERRVWFIIICFTIFGFFYVVNNARNDYNNRPIFMTLESKKYHIKNIEFPAIALCNHNRISKANLQKLVHELYERVNDSYSSKEELFDDATMFGYLYDFSLQNYAEVLSFSSILNKLKLQEVDEDMFGENIGQLMNSLTPSCEDMLLKCMWNETVYNCSDLFRSKTTQFGFCCTFNYYDTEAGRKPLDPLEIQDKPYKLNTPGSYDGLRIVLNALKDDYIYTTRPSFGFDVLIFNRYDYADQTGGGLVHRLAQIGGQYNFKITPFTNYATESIKKFSPEQRNCKFPDDMPEKYNYHYSYSNCIIRCRMRTILRLCHCVPFFLPKRSDVSPCTLNELACLNKYKQKLLFLFPPYDFEGLELEREDSLSCPNCMPDCAVTRYKVSSNRMVIHEHDWSDVLEDIHVNVTDISIVQIYYADRVSDLYRMDVTSHWFEMISYLGGLSGLFNGFSMMSLAEFIYFFVIRFTLVLASNFRDYS